MNKPKSTGKAETKTGRKIGVKAGKSSKAKIESPSAETPKKRPGRPRSTPETRKRARARVVTKLLKNVEEKLGGGTVKATFGDYIRLVELQKELEVDEPREIKVTWVETSPEGDRKSESEG